MTYEVSVVLCALNASAVVETQIVAVLREVTVLEEKRNYRIQLVLVDNASSDSTRHIFERYAATYENVFAVFEPAIGLNRARNAGVRAALAEKVLLCDADDVVLEGWLESMSSVLDEFHLVGCQVEPVTFEGVVISPFRQPWDHSLLWDLRSPWGCACGFRKKAWEYIEGFTEHLPIGGEEQDFFIRAQIEGFTLGWVDRPLLRYVIATSPEKEALRSFARERCYSHSYWYGRVRGKSRRKGSLNKCFWLASRVPKFLLIRSYRPVWRKHYQLQIIRFHSGINYGLPLALSALRSGRFQWRFGQQQHSK